jgi:hypothetical protein
MAMAVAKSAASASLAKRNDFRLGPRPRNGGGIAPDGTSCRIALTRTHHLALTYCVAISSASGGNAGAKGARWFRTKSDHGSIGIARHPSGRAVAMRRRAPVLPLWSEQQAILCPKAHQATAFAPACCQTTTIKESSMNDVSVMAIAHTPR